MTPKKPSAIAGMRRGLSGGQATQAAAGIRTRAEAGADDAEHLAPDNWTIETLLEHLNGDHHGNWSPNGFPKHRMMAEHLRLHSRTGFATPELGTDVPNLPVRTKPVRVTLDLDQETYTALNQWLGSAAAEVGAPVSKARALRAMIRAASLDKSIGLVVTDLLRRDSGSR